MLSPYASLSVGTLIAHSYMLRLYNLSVTCEIGNEQGVIVTSVIIT